MKVVVDVDKCIGATQCIRAAPTVFEQGDDGLVFLLQKNPSDDLLAQVQLAARSCPTRAIAVEEN